jgi:hypothetical protein
MPTVGVHGGHSVYELGPPSDVNTFFRSVEKYVARTREDQDYHLLTDRLYRRYLRQDELGPAAILLGRVQQAFSQVRSDSVNWQQLGVDPAGTRLGLDQATLADAFAAYFDRFARAKRSAESFFDEFEIYQPVKILISDMPELLIDKQRLLQEYDALTGRPFWMRTSSV